MEKLIWGFIVGALVAVVVAVVLQGCIWSGSTARSWSGEPAAGYEKGNPARYGLGYVREVPPIRSTAPNPYIK